MATEYKLSYTAAEINRKLGMVDQISETIENLGTELDGTIGVIRGGTGLNSITSGNFIVGNGTESMVEMTPNEVLSYINGASVMAMTTAEYEELKATGATKANTLYMLTDSDDQSVVTGNNIQLFDTVNAYGTLEVKNIALPEYVLNVTLSSETYADLSGVTVILTSEDHVQSAVANADGSVVGLLSKPSFILSLETNLDTSDILITCTYQLDLNKVLHDYILHVDLDGELGGSSSGELCNRNVVYRTQSAKGMMAITDASSVEHDVTVVVSSDTYDDVSGITVSFVTELNSEGNVVHQSAVTDENGTVTLRSVSEPWIIVLEKDGNQIGFLNNDFIITCTYQMDLQTALNNIENNIQDLETSKASKDYVTEEIQDALDGFEYDGGSSVEVDTTLSVQGASADAKVTGDKIKALEDLVGTNSVSDQIEAAINGIDFPESSVESVNGKTGVVELTASDVGALPDTTEIPSVEGLASEQFVTDKIEEAFVQEVYVQDEAPTDAVEGSIWVDTHNDGLVNSANPKFHIVNVTGTNVNNIDFSQYAIGDIILAFYL